MIWGRTQLFNPEIRRICMFLDMFHVYKKMLENIWRQPELYRTFIAPLMHSFYPNSKVAKTGRLKQIELILTCCQLVYPSVRQEMQLTLALIADSKIKQHLRNIIFMFEFLIPTVYFQNSEACVQSRNF